MGVEVGQQLFKIFGKGEIGDKVKDFDFSKISTTNKEKDDFLHVGLAPSYGTLTREAIKNLDDGLKVMISSTMRSLAERLSPPARNWDTVISLMTQNPYLEPDGMELRHAKFMKNSSGDFKTDGSPNVAIVQEVNSWFGTLINDEDVVKSTNINIDVLAKIVAQAGATIDSFESNFDKRDFHMKPMVDIVVLRFPDISNPFFKVYRIQLKAWSAFSSIMFRPEEKYGITGDYHFRRFKPRAEILKQDNRFWTKAAEDLFV